MSEHQDLAPSEPVADDAFTRFELRSGIRRIAFTVSVKALEALSGVAAPSTATQRRQLFDKFRIPINAVAQRKVDALAQALPGTATISFIQLTARDVAGIVDGLAAARAAKIRHLQVRAQAY